MPNYSRTERAALADLMDEVGPDAPTLCEGWTTRDLAAHLVVREARPDAALGVVGGPLAGWTKKVQDGAAQEDYRLLVDKVRTGPPTLSFFSLPGVDAQANLLEYVVHHEDVRRGGDDWKPRDIPADLADQLWGRAQRMARVFCRRVPVGLVLRRTDGAGGEIVAKSGPNPAVVAGTAMELTLLLYGRKAIDVEWSGSPESVAAVKTARFGL